MKREDDEELWDLLGKASQPAVSPFFARNVVRQIRQERDGRGTVRWWFSSKRLIPAAAVAVVVLATLVSIRTPIDVPGSSEKLPDTVAELDAQDYEVVADLDDLLALEEDSVWTDTSSL
jgi:hypothetical protein